MTLANTYTRDEINLYLSVIFPMAYNVSVVKHKGKYVGTVVHIAGGIVTGGWADTVLSDDRDTALRRAMQMAKERMPGRKWLGR